MIDLTKNIFIFKKNIVWFPTNLKKINIKKNITYFRQHNLELIKKNIIHEEDFLTLHINLSNSTENIYQSFKPATKYDIRKCNEMNLNFLNIDINDSIEINKFIKEVKFFYKKKGLSNLFNIKKLPKDNLILFILKDTRDWYSYSLFIKDEIRIRLLIFINNYEKIPKKYLGYSSKKLIWETIKYAKNIENKKIFDFGGLSKDSKLIGINKFKESFSGNLVYEKNTLYSELKFIRFLYSIINIFRR